MIKVLCWGMSGNLGGIESFIFNTYKNIDKSKIQMDFLVAHDREKIAYEDEIIAMGGKIHRVMYSESESLIKARTSLKKFFKEHNDYDVMHIHANFPYAFPLKYAKKAGVPVRILHSHNSNKDQVNYKGIKKIISSIRDRQVKKHIDKYPNYYFACSDLAAEFMFPGKEYKWIKNGINTDVFKYDEIVRKETREELNIPEGYQALGFIGRIREQKNPYFIIDIFREYLKLNEKTKLVIVGIGEWEKQIKEYAKELIDNGQALFLGKRKDSNRIYQAIDAFLLPSFYEGLPVVLVESQTAGLPSFTSDVVTKQVELTDLVHYYPLSLGEKEWAKNILDELQKYERKDYSNAIIKKGFEEKESAKEIEKFYLENVNK